VRQIEGEWEQELGAERFAQLASFSSSSTPPASSANTTDDSQRDPPIRRERSEDGRFGSRCRPV
jgi:hypothetical protein